MLFDDLFAPWLKDLGGRVPGLELFDAHTHIGQNDPDGFRSSREELTQTLAAADSRAAVFPMHEPGGYGPANDAVIAQAARSEGVLTAFCRLDPEHDPLREAERSLSAGATGIKLHPRAENFLLDTPSLEPVFALAGERNLPVLVHAGRGIPALGRHAVAVCERHPGLRLILAHCGISDLAWIWRPARELPNLFFDTAWWSAADLLSVWTLVAPGQVLFASDAPYASTASAAYINLRYAMQAGLGEEAMRVAFGGQMARLVAGEAPLDAGPPPGPVGLDADPLLDRAHTFLVAAIGQMFTGVEPTESLALAGLACEVEDGAPQAAAFATVRHLLEVRRRHLESGQEEGRPPRFRPGLPLVVAAAGVARTPGVPMPAL